MYKKRKEKRTNPVPIYSEEAEKGVLGSLLQDSRLISKCVKAGITEDSFHIHANKIIYNAFNSLHNESKHFDILMVTERLSESDKIQQIGTEQYLNELVDVTPTVAHVQHYIEIVVKKAKLREIVALCKKSEQTALTSEEKIESTLSKIKFEFHNLRFSKKATETITDLTSKLVKMYENAKKTGSIGLKSRWYDFHKEILCYEAAKITVIAARPGNGKTAFCLNELLHKALCGIPVLIISIEMSKEKILERFISDLADIDLLKFKQGDASLREIEQFRQAGLMIATLPIYIEHGNFTIEEIGALVREHKEEYDIQLYAIDYIQIIAPTLGVRFSNRNTELTHMSQTIMHLGNETKVHCMLCSQLSRYQGSGKYKVREPDLQHLRDCGAIEQDAEAVLFIYQNPDETEIWCDNAPTIFKLGKIRGGTPSKTNMIFQKSRVRFLGQDKLSLKQMMQERFRELNAKKVTVKKEEPVPF